MATILERDSGLGSPSFTIVSASAGSGKTYTLTLRYVQLLLSPLVPRNALKNILAITFTNNAAAEMRQRVLKMLKEVALGDVEAMAAAGSLVSLPESELRNRARRLVDEILDNFSDFQVRTIDSFLGQVFRASALEFGFNPEFELLMSNRELVEYAFELYAKEIRPDAPVTGEFMRMADAITSVVAQGQRVYLGSLCPDCGSGEEAADGRLLAQGRCPRRGSDRRYRGGFARRKKNCNGNHRDRRTPRRSDGFPPPRGACAA